MDVDGIPQASLAVISQWFVFTRQFLVQTHYRLSRDNLPSVTGWSTSDSHAMVPPAA